MQRQRPHRLRHSLAAGGLEGGPGSELRPGPSLPHDLIPVLGFSLTKGLALAGRSTLQAVTYPIYLLYLLLQLKTCGTD